MDRDAETSDMDEEEPRKKRRNQHGCFSENAEDCDEKLQNEVAYACDGAVATIVEAHENGTRTCAASSATSGGKGMYRTLAHDEGEMNVSSTAAARRLFCRCREPRLGEPFCRMIPCAVALTVRVELRRLWLALFGAL
jgi:hypothetical protein